MVRTRRPLFLLVGVLLLVPLAHGAKATVSATATITGSGTSYRLTVRNTGDEPLKCFGLLLDRVQPTSATGPAGVLTRVGTFQGKGLVHMQAQTSDIAAPGGTAVADFITNLQIEPNSGGEIRYSSTCQAGSDQIGRATGPTPPTPKPQPKPQRCKCKSLTYEIGRYMGSGIYATIQRPRRQLSFEMRLAGVWTLTCTRGSGGCRASIEVRVPPALEKSLALQLRFATSKAKVTAGSVLCEGRCGKRRTEGYAFDVYGGSQLGFGKRGVTTRSLTLHLFTNCGGKRTRREITIVFAKDGRVDYDGSDFNGNDVPDGREKN